MPAATSRRCNGPDRGNSASRRARKRWMLGHFGDGTVVHCSHCDAPLTFDTVEADRVIPGSLGGSYRRDNIVPSCRHCNASRKDAPLVDFHLRVGRVTIAATVGS
jgi:5-methylcytosine-specific restriction endonuclease McrA